MNLTTLVAIGVAGVLAIVALLGVALVIGGARLRRVEERLIRDLPPPSPEALHAGGLDAPAVLPSSEWSRPSPSVAIKVSR